MFQSNGYMCAQKTRWQYALFLFALLPALLVLNSCGSSSTPAATPAISASCTITSVNASATSQCSAFISNLSSTLVTWEVNSVTSGNSTFGTIDTNGLYTAPTTVPANNIVTITAIAQAQTTLTATVSITILPPAAISAITCLNSSNQSTQTVGVRQHVALYPDGDRRRKYRCVLVRQRQPHVQFNARPTPIGNGGILSLRHSDSHWQPIDIPSTADSSTGRDRRRDCRFPGELRSNPVHTNHAHIWNRFADRVLCIFDEWKNNFGKYVSCTGGQLYGGQWPDHWWISRISTRCPQGFTASNSIFRHVYDRAGRPRHDGILRAIHQQYLFDADQPVPYCN